MHSNVVLLPYMSESQQATHYISLMMQRNSLVTNFKQSKSHLYLVYLLTNHLPKKGGRVKECQEKITYDKHTKMSPTKAKEAKPQTRLKPHSSIGGRLGKPMY